jgi:tRNA(fMet)-specific endonuclease VapC
MKFMLDTNTCIYIIKHHPPEVKKKLERIPVGEVAVSSIVLAELWYGIERSAQRKNNEVALGDFLQYVAALDWPIQAAPIYGRVRGRLAKKGTPIGANDLLIAAHALALDAVLVTDNVREFRRVPKLRIVNWVER